MAVNPAMKTPNSRTPLQAQSSPLVTRIGRGLLRLAQALMISVLFAFAFFSDRIIQDVNSGELGIRWRRFGGGTETDRVYPEGMHLIWPWDKFYTYDMREQQVSQDTIVYARDGLEISVRASIRFRPKASTLTRLHFDLGPDYQKKIVIPEAISSIRKVLGNYTPEMIYAKDEEGLLAELSKTLRSDITTDYIQVTDFLILELRLPLTVEDAIKAKLTEEQRMLSYRFRLARERDEKQRRIIEAEGVREFEKISGLSMLRWRGIEATETLAASPNSKIILMGTGAGQLPVVLNSDVGFSGAASAAAHSPSAQSAPKSPVLPGTAPPGLPAPVPPQSALVPPLPLRRARPGTNEAP